MDVSHDAAQENKKPFSSRLRDAVMRHGLLYAVFGAAITVAIVLVVRKDREPTTPYPLSPKVTQTEFDAIARKATAGDVQSQLYMGVFHANGNGVVRDYAEAAKWYVKAAEQGNARAMRNLGVLYECGIGVERDYQKAFDYYWRAASLGDAAAHLGVAGYRFTRREKIMPPELGKYNRWRLKGFYLVDLKFDDPLLETSFWKQYLAQTPYNQDDLPIFLAVKKSAESDPESRLRVAQFYLQGQGVKRDYYLCGDWLRKAAAAGESRAKYLLGHVQEPMINVVPGAESKEAAKKLLREAAESGEEPLFLFHYARAESKEEGNARAIDYLVRQGYGPAIEYYPNLDPAFFDAKEYVRQIEAHAESGHMWAMKALATLYAVGKYVDKDFEKSVYWIERVLASSTDDPSWFLKKLLREERIHNVIGFLRWHSKQKIFVSPTNYHLRFYETLVKDGDIGEFLQWHRARAANGDVLSRIMLAISLDEFVGPNDDRKVNFARVRHCLAAAESGHPFAFYLLGDTFHHVPDLAGFDQETTARINKCLERYNVCGPDTGAAFASFAISAELGFLPAYEYTFRESISEMVHRSEKSCPDGLGKHWLRECLALPNWYGFDLDFSLSLYFKRENRSIDFDVFKQGWIGIND